MVWPKQGVYEEAQKYERPRYQDPMWSQLVGQQAYGRDRVQKDIKNLESSFSNLVEQIMPWEGARNMLTSVLNFRPLQGCGRWEPTRSDGSKTCTNW